MRDDEILNLGDDEPGDLEAMKAEMRERDEVTFDIDTSSARTRMEAYGLLAVMFKRHFLLLFTASAIVATSVFVAFATFASITWATQGMALRNLAINLGFLAMPVVTFSLLPVLERVVYARDNWTLERLGYDGLGTASGRRAMLAALVPLACVIAIVPGSIFHQNLSNPFWLAFIAGGVPVVVMEEILFRGVYWKYSIMRFGKTSKVNVYLVNAVMFTLIHLPLVFIIYVDSLLRGTLSFMTGQLGLMMASYFVAALVLCTLRDALDQLVAPVAYHVTFNIIVLVFALSPAVLLLVELVILGIVVAMKISGILKAPAPASNTPAAAGKDNILVTKQHAMFRLAYFTGCVLVAVYYASQAFSGDLVAMIIAAALATGTGVAAWFLLARKRPVTA